MERAQLNGVIKALALCIAIYAAIGVIVKFASEPLLHTVRTEGYYHADLKWLAFIGFGGVVSVMGRSRVPLLVLPILYWMFFSPMIAWSGPGDQLQSVEAMTAIKAGLYLGGMIIYGYLISRSISRRSSTPLKPTPLNLSGSDPV